MDPSSPTTRQKNSPASTVATPPPAQCHPPMLCSLQAIYGLLSLCHCFCNIAVVLQLQWLSSCLRPPISYLCGPSACHSLLCYLLSPAVGQPTPPTELPVTLLPSLLHLYPAVSLSILPQDIRLSVWSLSAIRGLPNTHNPCLNPSPPATCDLHHPPPRVGLFWSRHVS